MLNAVYKSTTSFLYKPRVTNPHSECLLKLNKLQQHCLETSPSLHVNLPISQMFA